MSSIAPGRAPLAKFRALAQQDPESGGPLLTALGRAAQMLSPAEPQRLARVVAASADWFGTHHVPA